MLAFLILSIGLFAFMILQVLALILLPAAAIVAGFWITSIPAQIKRREEAVTEMEKRLASFALVLLSIVGPLTVISFVSTSPENSSIDPDFFSTAASLLTQITLQFWIASTCAAFFARELSHRHAPYHATHCHDCGYNLTTLESDTCPECGLAIHESQKLAIASFSQSNGSHSTESSPT